MYSIVTLVNKNVLHIWKLLKARSQNDLITRKKYCITIWWHVNYTYYGDHFAMYTNIICQLCLNQKKMTFFLRQRENRDKSWKMTKQKKLYPFWYHVINSDLSVVLGLQNLPYYTQRNPIQEETKNPFLLMIFGGKENNIFTYMFTNICIKWFFPFLF